MNMIHAQPFLDAMHARVPAALGEHLDPNVTLSSPFVTDSFVGRDAVVRVLKALLAGVDEFETTAIVDGENRAAIMLRIRAGEAQVTGVDDMIVGEDGRIVSMTVQWRPLAGIVAIQQRLAPLVGVPALELVEQGRG